jgi:hypothetical protein
VDADAWQLSGEFVRQSLVHGSEEVRAVAWTLVTTRAQASKPVEDEALACIKSALPLVVKAHESFAKDRLRCACPPRPGVLVR